jgi:hypothetical protein
MREARESAIVGSERFVVRPATAGDIKEMSGILERAGLSSSKTLEFNLANSSAQMFVGCRDGLVVGVAGCVRLGFHLARRVRRMRLGSPVPGYRPGMIYNAFSLAAG